MIYEISRKQVTDTANWQTGYIKLSKPENDTSNSWERKNVTQLSKTADESYQEVLGLPQYNNQGQAFNYQTTRELAVPITVKKNRRYYLEKHEAVQAIRFKSNQKFFLR